MVKYIVGSEKLFVDFINTISSGDKVAILTHTDLDGITSAIFIQKILESKGLRPKLIKFSNYNKNLLMDVENDLRKNKITKLIITDVFIDNICLDDFVNLSKKIDSICVDHHPVNDNAKSINNILKTETFDCTSLVLFELSKNFCDLKDWLWLLDATMISEFSYKKQDNLDFIKSRYPEITLKNISESVPGQMSHIIGSGLIYYSKNLKKVFEIVKNRNLTKLEKIDGLVKVEIQKWIEKFKMEAEPSRNKDIYFYYFNPKFNITSVVTTLISINNPDTTYMLVSDISEDPDFVKISARCQSGKTNMDALTKKGIIGLLDATAGGHVPAAGARIRKEDLAKFKENILK